MRYKQKIKYHLYLNWVFHFPPSEPETVSCGHKVPRNESRQTGCDTSRCLFKYLKVALVSNQGPMKTTAVRSVSRGRSCCHKQVGTERQSVKTGTVTSLMNCVWIYGRVESSTWLVSHRRVAVFVTMAQAAELKGCQPTHSVCMHVCVCAMRGGCTH